VPRLAGPAGLTTACVPGESTGSTGRRGNA
jgi:hypothetical protein